MIEVYSNNVTVSAGATFPLNNVKIIKGSTATLNGNSIQLNRAGVYSINVALSVEPVTAGEVSVALYKNGLPDAGSGTGFTGVLDTINTASFPVLVQCPQNNDPCCCCTAPTTISIVNTSEVDITGDIIVVVTKVC